MEIFFIILAVIIIFSLIGANTNKPRKKGTSRNNSDSTSPWWHFNDTHSGDHNDYGGHSSNDCGGDYGGGDSDCGGGGCD